MEPNRTEPDIANENVFYFLHLNHEKRMGAYFAIYIECIALLSLN